MTELLTKYNPAKFSDILSNSQTIYDSMESNVETLIANKLHELKKLIDTKSNNGFMSVQCIIRSPIPVMNCIVECLRNKSYAVTVIDKIEFNELYVSWQK
jgi:hypothetical protein